MYPRWISYRVKTPLYRAWCEMRKRCKNPKHKDFKYYGARGIRIHPRWEDYDSFATDVGPHPGNGLTLDRVNTLGNYEPGNTRWATRLVQGQNKRNRRK